MAADARRFAAFLLDRGVGPGQTVVAPLVSGWEATVVLAATSNVGATARPAAQPCLTVAGARAWWRQPTPRCWSISGRVLAKGEWQETLTDLRGSHSSLREVVLTDAPHAPPGLPNYLG